MDFGKLVSAIQKGGSEYSASKLEVGIWHYVLSLEVVPSMFGGTCVKAHLDNGDRVFLPPKLSRGLSPYANQLRKEDNWALRFMGFKENDISEPSGTTFRTPIFEMERKKLLVLEDIKLTDGPSSSSSSCPPKLAELKGQGSEGEKLEVVKGKKTVRAGRGRPKANKNALEDTEELSPSKRMKLQQKAEEKELLYENQILFVSDDEAPHQDHFIPDLFK